MRNGYRFWHNFFFCCSAPLPRCRRPFSTVQLHCSPDKISATTQTNTINKKNQKLFRIFLLFLVLFHLFAARIVCSDVLPLFGDRSSELMLQSEANPELSAVSALDRSAKRGRRKNVFFFFQMELKKTNANDFTCDREQSGGKGEQMKSSARNMREQLSRIRELR